MAALPRDPRLSKRLAADRSLVVQVCILPLLVCLSGLSAGLILAYFSLDQSKLRVLASCGKPREQVHARRILTLRNNSYLVLTTLVLLHVAANESIPVVASGIFPNYLHSTLISTGIILVFAALIPQSVCSRHALPVAGWTARGLWYLIWVASPVAWPIAKFLEWTLGQQNHPVFRQTELRELVRLHGAAAGGTVDETTSEITWNALTLSIFKAKDAMVPMKDVFSVPYDEPVNRKTFNRILDAGWSRILVYGKRGRGQVLLGYILSKHLTTQSPTDTFQPAQLRVYELPLVPTNMPLTEVLNALLTRQRFMALVYDLPSTFSDFEREAVPATWRDRVRMKIEAMRRNKALPKEEVADLEKAHNLAQTSALSVTTSRFDDCPTNPSHRDISGASGTVNSVGIITLEDIVQKLLGQEIRDEVDGWSPRYPRNISPSNPLTRVKSLPEECSTAKAALDLPRDARKRPTSSHYPGPALATVEESIPFPASRLAVTTRLLDHRTSTPNTSGHSPTNSISTDGSDGLSTRKSYRSNGQEGLTAVYVPDPQPHGFTNLTSGMKRSRSSRRYSMDESGLRLRVDPPNVVRERLGLGSPPPPSHRISGATSYRVSSASEGSWHRVSDEVVYPRSTHQV